MFENLFTCPDTIGRYRASPLLDERLSYLSHCAQTGSRPRSLREIAAHQVNLIRLLDLHESERVNVARIEARCRSMVASGRTPMRSTRTARAEDSSSSTMRCDGCASSTCSMNRSWRDMLMSTRWQFSKRGRRTNAGGPKKRLSVASERSIVFSMDWTNAESRWSQSVSATSTRRLHAGVPAPAAGTRFATTRIIFAHSFGSPNARAGAAPD